jgi:predicted DNA-binding protein (UPF0251 family)
MSFDEIPDFENDTSLTEKQKCRRRAYYADREANIRKSAEWQKMNPNKRKNSRDKWIRNNLAKNREVMIQSGRKYSQNNQEKRKLYFRSDQYKKSAKKSRLSIKEETMRAYGGHCVCCGEDRLEFLTLDHVNNDGYARRKNGEGAGLKLYRSLRNKGFPHGDFQVLCYNCNCSKGFHGYCPHEVEAKKLLGINNSASYVTRTRVAFVSTNPSFCPSKNTGKKRILSSEKEIEMLTMFRMGDMPVAEIADKFGISVQTLYNVIHRYREIAISGGQP